ncbi:MAG: sodium/solute symporter [Thermoguttaceae bacterium]|jgi:SSS family transporter
MYPTNTLLAAIPDLSSSALTGWDWLAIACYFSVLLAVAWWVIRRSKDTAADYFLAGRNLGWWVIGASIFASNIGSEHVVGLAGSGAADGVAMAHYELHAWCLLVLAWVFVPFYARSLVFTMPEFLERRFSPASRYVLSVVSLVTFIVSKIAVGIFAGGVVFATLLPEIHFPLGGVEINSFWIGSVLVIVLTGLYTMLGGMRAVAYNDAVQTLVLIVGSASLTIYGLWKLGGWGQLRAVCDPDMFNLWKPLIPAGVEGTWAPVKEPGRMAWYFNDYYPWLGMLFCAPIIGLWYWCTDQYIVQRALGAPDQQTARRGSIFAAFLKLSPVYLFIIPGLVCFALAKTYTVPGLAGGWEFKAEDFKEAELPRLSKQIAAHADLYSMFIWDQLSPQAREQLSAYSREEADAGAVRITLAAALNKIAGGPSIDEQIEYLEPNGIAPRSRGRPEKQPDSSGVAPEEAVPLVGSEETIKVRRLLWNKALQPEQAAALTRRLNRLVLEDSFPQAIEQDRLIQENGKGNPQKSQGAFPLMVKHLLPSGLRGLVVAGLLSALMGSLAGVFNACSTLFTVDLYQKWRPAATQHQIVRTGRIATAVMILIALAWIPVIQGAHGLYNYLQTVQAYLAPPIFVVFFLGVFFKRLNAKGCFAAMAVGFLLGLFRMIVDTPVTLCLAGFENGYAVGSFLWIVNNIFFQYFGVLITIVSAVVMVLVSYLTAEPEYGRIKGLTFGTTTAEDRSSTRASWRWPEVAASAVVVGAILAAYLYFRG